MTEPVVREKPIEERHVDMMKELTEELNRESCIHFALTKKDHRRREHVDARVYRIDVLHSIENNTERYLMQTDHQVVDRA